MMQNVKLNISETYMTPLSFNILLTHKIKNKQSYTFIIIESFRLFLGIYVLLSLFASFCFPVFLEYSSIIPLNNIKSTINNELLTEI